MFSFIYFTAPLFLTPAPAVPSLLPPMLAQVEEAAPADAADEAAADDAGPVSETETEADTGTQTEPLPHPMLEPETEAQPARPQNDMAAQLAQRAEISDIHRAFGIATWISMAGTLVLGGIQIRDEYGPGAADGMSTPCFRSATGMPDGAVFPDYCFDEVPVPHLVSAVLTSVLYYTTFTLSFFMPDPLGVAEAPGWAGERLRIHKTLRWFHFAGMVLTSIFGAITSNIEQTRDNFELRQGLAVAHLALGTTTFALLSAAALVILF